MAKHKKKKVNLTRFRKSTQGLIELACLIEQAEPKSSPGIISQIKQNDYDLYLRVMKKVVYFNELTYLDEGILAEVLSSTPPKIVSYALYYEEDKFREKFHRLLGLRELRLLKDEEEKIGATPSRRFVFGAQKTILKIARGLEADNKFHFELSDCPRFHTTKKVA